MKNKKLYEDLYNSIRKNKAINIGSENITGKNIVKCENIENGEWIVRMRNSRNVVV